MRRKHLPAKTARSPMTQRNFYERFGLWILLLFAAAIPVLLVGARGILQHVDNDVRNWLPSGFEETRRYDWFLEHFGTEEMVAVSWRGASLDDPRLLRFAELLKPYTAVTEASRPSGDGGAVPGSGTPYPGEGAARDPGGPLPFFREVYTGPGLIEELTSPPLNLSRREALRRLQGSFIGRDGELSALVAALGPVGAEHRHSVIAVLRREAEQAGVDPEEIHMGGPTVDSVALDIESERARNLLSLFSVAVGFILAWICLRRLELVLIVFASALLSTAISVSIMYFSGGALDLVTVMMPPLVYVLTISGAVHLINYHIDVLADHGSKDAVPRTVAIGWLPAVLTAATTAVGIGSLAMSDVLPVRRFGIYSAIGVLCAIPVLLLFLPALLQIWPLNAGRDRKHPEVPVGHYAHWTHAPVDVIARFHRVAFFALVTLILLMGSGLFRIQTSVRLLDLFSPEARIIQDYTWLEEHLGPLVPIELVVRFDEEEHPRQVDRLELIRAIDDRLNALPHVGGILSAATFTPPAERVRGIVGRRLLEERLREQQQRLVETGYLRNTDEGQLWRVSARVDATSPIDYGVFVGQLQEETGPLAAAWSEQTGVGTDLLITGMVPLVYKAQRALLRDLVTSFVAAFVLIGVMMMALLRSVRAGLLSMLPNVFPAVMVFGFLGWWGRPIGIGQMMTAGLALGIAVDDTIHLLNWFRRDTLAGLPRLEAIRTSFEHCTGAMLQTSIITGFGVLVFMFSAFVPTSSFAWLLFILLFLALLGELVLLPAILSGRWGRYFAKPPIDRDATRPAA